QPPASSKLRTPTVSGTPFEMNPESRTYPRVPSSDDRENPARTNTLRHTLSTSPPNPNPIIVDEPAKFSKLDLADIDVDSKAPKARNPSGSFGTGFGLVVCGAGV